MIPRWRDWVLHPPLKGEGGRRKLTGWEAVKVCGANRPFALLAASLPLQGSAAT
jgi:hypothetical protein